MGKKWFTPMIRSKRYRPTVTRETASSAPVHVKILGTVNTVANIPATQTKDSPYFLSMDRRPCIYCMVLSHNAMTEWINRKDGQRWVVYALELYQTAYLHTAYECTNPVKPIA